MGTKQRNKFNEGKYLCFCGLNPDFALESAKDMPMLVVQGLF